jgi:ribonuclease VapC
VIVDSSALLSVVFREEGHEAYLERLLEEPAPAIGAPTLVETGIVLTARLGPAARGLLERLIDELDLQEVPFSAYRRFGKGRHPADLNFGDCMTYAVASLAGEALLFRGEDFGHTDLEAALPSPS